MTAWKALPPIVREVVQSAAVVFVMLGSLVFAAVLSPQAWSWVLVALVVAMGITCFGYLLRTDPIAFLTIAPPPIVLAIVAAVAIRDARVVQLLIAAWLLTWTFATSTIWPWWNRVVLRRMRSGSPETEVRDAYRRLYVLSQTDEGWWDWAVWTKEIGGLGRWLTPRTAPVIAALTSIRNIWGRNELTDEGLRRILRRLGQELRRMVEPPRPWFFRGRSSVDLTRRPTAGTSLEYEYPQLEALLAEATPQERHQMGIEAARIALRVNDILTPAREAILVGAEHGPAPAEVIAAVDADQDRAQAEWMALDTERTGEVGAVEQALVLQARALSALACAISPLVWPLDETDAICEAASSLPADRETSLLEAMAEDVLGPERSGRAQMVPELDLPAPVAGATSGGTTSVDPWPVIATLPRGWRGLGRLVLLAFTAEIIATIANNAARPIYWRTDDAILIERTVYATVAAVTLYVGMRVWSGRPSLIDAILVFYAALVATNLFAPVQSAAHQIIGSISPDLWASLFTIAPNILPDILVDGIALAIVLVAMSLGLQAIRKAVDRQPKMTSSALTGDHG